MSNIYTIVVTYNRKALLLDCLGALENQTLKPNKVIIVDNASTDGTLDLLRETGFLDKPLFELLALTDNTGGAGGFSAGLDYAIKQGADWVWMMDDDARPHLNALEELMKVAKEPQHVYGSLAVNQDNTAWQMALLDGSKITTRLKADIPSKAQVQMLPFLGFMVHRDLVAQIGLPDAGFFIAADDVEYCVRAQNHGANIYVAGNSQIEHPSSYPYYVSILGHRFTCIAIPPWKRYYDVRNRILIAKKHFGFKLYTQTLPSILVRFIATLTSEPDKLKQVKAYCVAVFDGLLQRKGKRHEHWKL